MRKSILALGLTSVLLAGAAMPFLNRTNAVQDEPVRYIYDTEETYCVIEAWKQEEELISIDFQIEERHVIGRPPEGWGNRATDYAEPEPEVETILTEDEIRLVARMTMAEAEGESELGKRLVIDTILNRMDSSHFPNTIEGVLFQPHQFSPIESGRWDRCWARDDICDLVREECIQRQNYDCVYFQRGANCPWGVWMFKEGNHNFFSYKEV